MNFMPVIDGLTLPNSAVCVVSEVRETRSDME